MSWCSIHCWRCRTGSRTRFGFLPPARYSSPGIAVLFEIPLSRADNFWRDFGRRAHGETSFLAHQASCSQNGCNAHARVMAAGMTGEERCRHGGNFKQDEAGDETQHQKSWHEVDQSLRVIEIHCSAGQVPVKRVWRLVNPLLKGEPDCTCAAIGRKSNMHRKKKLDRTQLRTT